MSDAHGRAAQGCLVTYTTFRLLQLSYQALHAMANPNAALQESQRANMRRPQLQ